MMKRRRGEVRQVMQASTRWYLVLFTAPGWQEWCKEGCKKHAVNDSLGCCIPGSINVLGY